MRRWIAIAWHSSFLVAAAALYFLFVLPRWFELTGAWPVGLGTPLRIVCGVLIGLCALPVAFTLIHTRKPEFGTPQLALSMRFWSIVLHVVAGVLITGAAVAEIWLSLDTAGQWLFGIYGAAAAIAVLGALAFHLAYVAEEPPPPPKPLKPKAPGKRRSRKSEAAGDAEPAVADTTDATDAADAADGADAADESVAQPDADVEADTVIAETDTPDTAESPDDTESSESSDEDSGEPATKLRNRRPGGKRSRGFGRRGGGVTVDE